MKQIGDAVVNVGSSWVHTRFSDGSEVHAHPDGSDEQVHIARALGYEPGQAGVDRMNAEHDLLHTLVADARGWERSKTLHGVANGKYAAKEISDDEERIVMLIARLLNVGIAGVLTDYPEVSQTEST